MFKYQLTSASLLLRQFSRQKSVKVSAQLITNTAQQRRPVLNSAMYVEATVCDVKVLSPSVKGLTLKVDKSKFNFKPGQWVDLQAPGIKEIAGYSICSTPRTLERNGIFELAVKYSDFPTTDWVHKQCDIGTTVEVSPGGDFCYENQSASLHPADKPQSESLPTTQRNLLLIAGGVGINPLVSIMRHVAELGENNQSATAQVILAYSAANLGDLVFRDDIIQLVEEHSNMSAEFYITRSTADTSLPVQEYTSITFKKNVRIDIRQLARIIEEKFDGNKTDLDCFICGPAGLIDDANAALLQLGMLPEQIKYEKWW